MCIQNAEYSSPGPAMGKCSPSGLSRRGGSSPLSAAREGLREAHICLPCDPGSARSGMENNLSSTIGWLPIRTENVQPDRDVRKVCSVYFLGILIYFHF